MTLEDLQVLSTVLGCGRSTAVYLGRMRGQAPEGGRHELERLVAVKLLHFSWCHEHRERVAREAAHHMSPSAFNHPFISRMLGVELLPSGLALVMEYKEGAQTVGQTPASTWRAVKTPLFMSLDSLENSQSAPLSGPSTPRSSGSVTSLAPLSRLPQSVARQLFAQLMIALEFCHRLGLSNRDCKITDLLVHVDPANGDVKLQLTDFSFAKDHEHDWDSNPAAQHGSAFFAAPEVITGSPTARYSGCKADVWSAGVVLCTLVFGCHPHLAPHRLQASPEDQIVNVKSNALQGDIQVPAAKAAAHQDVFQLMAAMLSVNPAARPDASAVLAHPWVHAVLSSTPGLAVLNDGLLGDVRLREESIAVRETTRERTAMLLDQMLGAAGGNRLRRSR